MNSYHHLLHHILETGQVREDRTGVGTIGVFGYQLRHNLNHGQFPLLTTKRVWLHGVIVELLWMLRGDTNIKWLHEHGVHIWDEWADENGDLGPVYGAQWREFLGKEGKDRFLEGHDQITALINGLRDNPWSRRHLVTAWNPAEIEAQKLPPCHCLFQFHVREPNGRDEHEDKLVLSCQLYQRSADAFLGVPFNIASYSLLTLILCEILGYQPGEFVHTFGDLHIYTNHLDQVREQMSRTPRALPSVTISSEHWNWPGSINDLIRSMEPHNFLLDGYDPQPAIKAEVAV